MNTLTEDKTRKNQEQEQEQEQGLKASSDVLIHQILRILQRNPDEQFLRLALTKIANLEKVMFQ